MHSKTDWNIAIPISKGTMLIIFLHVCKFGEIRSSNSGV